MEPKFKVGQTITSKDGTGVYHATILEVTQYSYYCMTDRGTATISHTADDEYELVEDDLPPHKYKVGDLLLYSNDYNGKIKYGVLRVDFIDTYHGKPAYYEKKEKRINEFLEENEVIGLITDNPELYEKYKQYQELSEIFE